MRYLLTLLLAAIFIEVSAHPDKNENKEKPTIFWAYTDYPPGFIFKGKNKGLGYGDLLNKLIINNVEEFNHEAIIYPNWPRLKTELRKNKEKTICTSTLFYRPMSERENYKGKQLFSAPNFVFFLHDIVVKKSKRYLYNETVSLKELLENQNLKFGYSRSTGPISSKIIGDYIGVNEDISTMESMDRIKALKLKSNIVVRLSSDMVGGSLKMLFRERIDYILEYAFMVKYAADEIGLAHQFSEIPIKETLNNTSIGAFSCSATNDGHKMIQAINRILVEKRDSEEYKKLLHYLVPNDQKRQKLYWQEHQKILSIEQ